MTAPYPDEVVHFAIDLCKRGGLSYPAAADQVYVRWPHLKRPSWRSVQAWCAGENQKRRNRTRRAEEYQRRVEEERRRAAWLAQFDLDGVCLEDCRVAVPAGLRDYKVLQPRLARQEAG